MTFQPQPLPEDSGQIAVAVIFASGTVATGILAGFYPSFMPIFTVLVGVSGTIVGHYFGYSSARRILKAFQAK